MDLLVVRQIWSTVGDDFDRAVPGQAVGSFQYGKGLGCLYEDSRTGRPGVG
jgi:hypothetical protein